jgi:flagellar L-ring protein precursor FlgH
VGDVLTIVLEEDTNATKSAVTTTKKTTTEAMSAPTLLGAPLTVHGRNILNNALNDATTFDGEGGSSQSNQLTGSISVTVAKRLANGNLLVRGQKWITINQGREYVRIQGIVRPIDIGQDNTVPSTMVADATIAYGEEGTLNDANTKGWLARFFDSKWMPF